MSANRLERGENVSYRLQRGQNVSHRLERGENVKSFSCPIKSVSPVHLAWTPPSLPPIFFLLQG